MTPADFPKARRTWRGVTAAAIASAAAPASDDLAVSLRREIRGQNAAGFPLEARDSRLKPVGAFIELARFWVEAGAAARTPFAASLESLARDLESLLHAQAAAEARQSMDRQGLS